MYAKVSSEEEFESSVGAWRRLGLRLELGSVIGLGMGYRRKHSWSSIFMPRCNHSLCLRRLQAKQAFYTGLAKSAGE